jgi:RNA polymerase primary sigma factor
LYYLLKLHTKKINMRKMRQLKIVKQVTEREEVSLDKYLQEIGKIKLITADEEVELARRIKKGDTVALKQLAKANLRFVVSVAKYYQGQGLSLPDLISEGNFGLVKAAARFDETRGFKFISYAVWWIRQQILQSLAEHSRVVRLPLNKIGSISKINKAFAKLEQDYQRMPTAEELAEVLEMTTEEVKTSLSSNHRHISLDAPIAESDTSSGTLMDLIPNENTLSSDNKILSDDQKKVIRDSVANLSARESEVLTLFFGLDGNPPQTLEEIADHFELTREAVRQIKERGVRKLRHGYYGKALRTYLRT